MKLILGMTLIFMAFTMTVGCSEKPSASDRTAEQGPNDYVIEISGTEGLQMDLLLIFRPTPRGLERESSKVTVPYSKKLQGFGCAAWIDVDSDNMEGDYRMTLSINGQVSSEAEGHIKQGHKQSGMVGDL